MSIEERLAHLERQNALLRNALGQRERLEGALLESEKRYRALFDSIDEGFCVIEVIFDASGDATDYRFLEVNAAFERQTGLRDPVGRTMRSFAPNHERHWFEIYGKVATTGRPRRFERPAAQLGRYYDVYAFRVGEASERKVGVLFKDVAERKKAEDALREAHRRKDEFLAILGHELRNPLAPLMTGVELLREAPGQPGRIENLRVMMERQLGHIVHLVDDLLDLSRIGRGEVEMEHVRLDLNVVVDSAVEQNRPLMAERGHELVVKLAEKALPIEGDFQRLTQVACNLLNNAAKYTEPGGTVSVRTEVDGERREALLRVRDTGYGIPAEHLDSLFEMFSQIPEHRELIGPGGLGIGLALARELVSRHGGAIEASSDGPNRGSEFIVRLPLSAGMAPGVAREAASSAQTAPCRSAKRRVLVVDDNADAAESLRMMLLAEGHDARVAPDGAAALAAVRSFHPEFVLLDIGLPRMDGYEVAQRIRAMSAASDIRLVAVSGWGQEEDKHRSREAGFDIHLTKPVSAATLASVLRGAAPD